VKLLLEIGSFMLFSARHLLYSLHIMLLGIEYRPSTLADRYGATNSCPTVA
jgi:hypothetical protein